MPSRTANDMSASERRRALKRYLEQHGEIGLAEACREFGASTATVRRDFHALASSGLAEKQWGLLRAKDKSTSPAVAGPMTPFAEREILEVEAKSAVGRAAAEMVTEGDVVMIDGGTTTLQMVTHLAGRRVKIITNSIAIAHAIDRERAGRQGAEVFLTGGQLYPDSFLLVGPQARATLANYRARWAFLSAAGLDEAGVTNSNELVVETEQAMIAQAERTVLLADASKFGRRAMMTLCDLGELHVLVTNRLPPPGLRRELAAAGVEICTTG